VTQSNIRSVKAEFVQIPFGTAEFLPSPDSGYIASRESVVTVNSLNETINHLLNRMRNVAPAQARSANLIATAYARFLTSIPREC